MDVISYAIDAWCFYYKRGNINWLMVVYITLTHVAAIIGLMTITSCHKYTLVWAYSLWPIS